MWKQAIVILVLISISVTAQVTSEVPKDTNVAVISKIQQEHQTTRQFFANEMTRINNENMAEFTKRANYYEEQFRDINNATIIKMGLLVGGIYLFLSSFSYWLRSRVEKRRYAVLRKTLGDDIKADIKKETMQFPKEIYREEVPSYQQPKQGLEKIFGKSPVDTGQMRTQPVQGAPKFQYQPEPGFFERRRIRKAQKRLARIESEERRLAMLKARLQGA
jgi:hypothetical protein